MTISGTLSSALSGLNVSARAAELVSTNIANALTEGYGRRDLHQAARTLDGSGQGVRVTGVSRAVDQVLLSDRRIAEAGAGGADLQADFLRALEQSIGTPDADGSLSARIAAFDAALIAAASRPDSEARLADVRGTALALTGQFAAISATLQTARATADDRIAADVALVNDTLARVAEMNGQIRAHIGAGRDASALMDQRQQLIDQISDIVPLRQVDRDHGQIALYTTGGAVLLDGRPATLGFTPVGVITPDMTVGSGALSGLTINGRPVRTLGDTGAISGGTLAANFEIRDQLAVDAQARLDAVARDLVERFADPAVDTTLLPGAAGLFTDQGAAFDPLDEVGLTARLALNPAADPAQGGALWRLRDGMGAASPGPAGDPSLLTRMQAALTAARTPVSGGFMTGGRSLTGLAADLLSGVASARLSAVAEGAFAAAKAETLRSQELEGGVDTDQEMQKLLLIERAYAANAKVIQTVDDMIQTLLGL